jgi:Xaa-Pro aminopeptidase
MIVADRRELAEPRRRRWESALAAAGIDGWLLTSSTAIRLAFGAHSDSIDRDGEVCWPLIAAGRSGGSGRAGPDALVESAVPVVDARLVDDVMDRLPVTGRLAVDRLGLAALERMTELRPGLEVVDAGPFLAAARRHKDPAEVAAILEGNARAEAALSAVLGLAQPGVASESWLRPTTPPPLTPVSPTSTWTPSFARSPPCWSRPRGRAVPGGVGRPIAN